MSGDDWPAAFRMCEVDCEPGTVVNLRIFTFGPTTCTPSDHAVDVNA